MEYLYKWYDDTKFSEFGRLFGRTGEPRVLGHLPTWRREGEPELKRTSRMNRYLRYQEGRINRAVTEGNFEGAIIIWCLILKSSLAYQLTLFHRANSNWFWKKTGGSARTDLIHIVDKLRSWQLEMLLERFYLKKPNGKLRPIGAPDLYSKVIAKAFNDMTIRLFGEDLNDTHHGFMPKRGIHTAILNVMCNYYEKGLQQIYEFDLRSWFNRVNPSWVRKKLSEKSEFLAAFVYKLIHDTNYRWSSKLYREDELIPRGRVFSKKIWKPLIERSGLPQGSPMSPILSTIAIANMPRPEGLVMYADDGILMGKDSLDYKFFDSIGKVGAEIAEEKSRLVNRGRLSFLGLTIDFEKKELNYNNLLFRYVEWNSETAVKCLKWLQSERISYTNNQYVPGWYWTINPKSYINSQKVSLRMLTRVKIVWYSMWKAESYQGYRLMGWKIRDVLGGSSWSLNELAKDLASKKFRTRKPFQWVGDYSEEIRDKGGYCEYLSEENGIAKLNISILQEDLAVFMKN